MVEIVKGGVVGGCFFAMPIAPIGDFGSKRIAGILAKRDEKRNISRKVCLDEKGMIIGAILINQVDGIAYENILQGRL